MALRIAIPSPLQQYTESKDTVEVPARTVAEALANLAARYEGLRKHLFTAEGKLRTFVNVYLNDEDVRYLAQGATPVGESDTLAIIPSIAGGLGIS